MWKNSDKAARAQCKPSNGTEGVIVTSVWLRALLKASPDKAKVTSDADVTTRNRETYEQISFKVHKGRSQDRPGNIHSPPMQSIFNPKKAAETNMIYGRISFWIWSAFSRRNWRSWSVVGKLFVPLDCSVGWQISILSVPAQMPAGWNELVFACSAQRTNVQAYQSIQYGLPL